MGHTVPVNDNSNPLFEVEYLEKVSQLLYKNYFKKLNTFVNEIINIK